jgi:hypothetical protein
VVTDAGKSRKVKPFCNGVKANCLAVIIHYKVAFFVFVYIAETVCFYNAVVFCHKKILKFLPSNLLRPSVVPIDKKPLLFCMIDWLLLSGSPWAVV